MPVSRQPTCKCPQHKTITHISTTVTGFSKDQADRCLFVSYHTASSPLPLDNAHIAVPGTRSFCLPLHLGSILPPSHPLRLQPWIPTRGISCLPIALLSEKAPLLLERKCAGVTVAAAAAATATTLLTAYSLDRLYICTDRNLSLHMHAYRVQMQTDGTSQCMGQLYNEGPSQHTNNSMLIIDHLR